MPGIQGNRDVSRIACINKQTMLETPIRATFNQRGRGFCKYALRQAIHVRPTHLFSSLLAASSSTGGTSEEKNLKICDNSPLSEREYYLLRTDHFFLEYTESLSI